MKQISICMNQHHTSLCPLQNQPHSQAKNLCLRSPWHEQVLLSSCVPSMWILWMQAYNAESADYVLGVSLNSESCSTFTNEQHGHMRTLLHLLRYSAAAEFQAIQTFPGTSPSLLPLCGQDKLLLGNSTDRDVDWCKLMLTGVWEEDSYVECTGCI